MVISSLFREDCWHFFKKGYNALYICKHIVTLAIKEKFQIKGFIPVDPLVSNTKSGRKKVEDRNGEVGGA